MANDKIKEIAQAAKIYSDAAFLLNQSVKLGQDDLKALFPSQVLAALSLELYLKTIYSIEKGSGKFSHNLESIFGELEESTKIFIIDIYIHIAAILLFVSIFKVINSGSIGRCNVYCFSFARSKV